MPARSRTATILVISVIAASGLLLPLTIMTPPPRTAAVAWLITTAGLSGLGLAFARVHSMPAPGRLYHPVLLTTGLVFGITAATTPPDPATQLLYGGPALGISLLATVVAVAYDLDRDALDWIRTRTGWT